GEGDRNRSSAERHHTHVSPVSSRRKALSLSDQERGSEHKGDLHRIAGPSEGTAPAAGDELQSVLYGAAERPSGDAVVATAADADGAGLRRRQLAADGQASDDR